jgi:hypothetical protein
MFWATGVKRTIKNLIIMCTFKLLPVDSFCGVSKVPLVVTELQPLYLICSFQVEQFAGRHRMLLLAHPTERYRYCVKN